MQPPINSSRNSSIEILRFVFMFLIVLLHVYVHGTNLDYETIYHWGNNWNTVPSLIFFTLGKIGVTGFIFISGYYGIKTNVSKIINLILITLFYLLILLPFGKNNISLILHPFDGWWFISAYLFIMLLAPLIENGIKIISHRTFRNIVIASFIYTYFAKALSVSNSHDVILLLTVYLFARYFSLHLHKYCLNKFESKTFRLIGISALMLLIIMPIFFNLVHLPTIFFDLFLQNNNPLLLVISAWLIYEADLHVFYNSFINKVMKSALAIYIITDSMSVRPILTKTLLPYVLNGISGYFIIFIICICCLLIDQFRLLLFRFLYKIYFKLKEAF